MRNRVGDCAIEAEESDPIAAQLYANDFAHHKLRSAVQSGKDQFLIVSEDGDIAIRARIIVESFERARTREPFEGVQVNWQEAILTNGDREIHLTPTDSKILAALMEGAGKTVTRAELGRRLWPGTVHSTGQISNSIPVYVCALRKRLASVGLSSTIQTVRAAGYRLQLRSEWLSVD